MLIPPSIVFRREVTGGAPGFVCLSALRILEKMVEMIEIFDKE